jgi:hypothetical protein
MSPSWETAVAHRSLWRRVASPDGHDAWRLVCVGDRRGHGERCCPGCGRSVCSQRDTGPPSGPADPGLAFPNRDANGAWTPALCGFAPAFPRRQMTVAPIPRCRSLFTTLVSWPEHGLAHRLGGSDGRRPGSPRRVIRRESRDPGRPLVRPLVILSRTRRSRSRCGPGPAPAAEATSCCTGRPRGRSTVRPDSVHRPAAAPYGYDD